MPSLQKKGESHMTAGRNALLAAVTAALLLSAGCLLKETTETWYLEPDAAVTWIVLESDVRSDAQTLLDRQTEEAPYQLAISQDNHPIARGLRQLGPDSIKTLVLRGEVPFTVRTEARFRRIDWMGQRLIEQSGMSGTSILVRDGTKLEWTLTVRDPHATDVEDRLNPDVTELLNDLDSLRVVLIGGEFDSATGFELSPDRRVVTFKEPEAAGKEDPIVTLQLRWIVRPS
jgi:hypothetical protein